MSSKSLMTRRTKAHYGDKAFMAGTPVAVIKAGGKTDFVTPEEFLEDLYGRAVERIVFKKEE